MKIFSLCGYLIIFFVFSCSQNVFADTMKNNIRTKISTTNLDAIKDKIVSIIKTKKNNSSPKASITDYHCISDQSFNLSSDLDLGDDGVNVGYEQLLPYTNGGNYTGTCYIPSTTRSQAYYYARSDYIADADGFLKLTPTFSAKVAISILNNATDPVVPFDRVGNGSTRTRRGPSEFSQNFASGREGSVTIRIDNAIVGVQNFSGELARLSVVLSTTATFDPTQILARINLNASVTSTADCQFVGGETFTLDLGSVNTNDLNETGIPDGYSAVPLDLSVSCSGLDPSVEELAYSFDGTRVSGSDKYVASNNSSIGVGILDENDDEITLGVDNPIIVPFDSATDEAEFTPKFYPIQIAGESKASAGAYSSTIIATVTLP